MHTADLLIDTNGPEIRHRTGLTAADEFIYLKTSTEEVVFANSLEYDTQLAKLQQLQSSVQLEHIEPYTEQARANTTLKGYASLLNAIFQAKHINTVRISGNMPYRLVQLLEQITIPFEVHDFTIERLHKTAQEIEFLKHAQQVTNGAFDIVKTLLTQSTINGKYLEYNGKILTSEAVKTIVQTYFLQQNYSCIHGIIVASKEQSACPHEEGSGPIFAHEALVVDIFPRSNATGYYADMSRTFVKGTPSDALQQQYEAVLTVQTEAINMMEIDINSKDVHEHCVQRFIDLGFINTDHEGFIHSTGHGLGLELHESPSISTREDVFMPGMVVTVEPGLYYKNIGGVRIEDVVVFHPDGTKENITNYSKEWIIA